MYNSQLVRLGLFVHSLILWPYSFEHNVIFIMSYYECEAGEHLAPLPRIGDENDSDNDSNSSDDSDVEVVSTYDADEY